MLILKEPMLLRAVEPFACFDRSFEERIRANYELLSCHMTAADLLYLTMAPAEAFPVAPVTIDIAVEGGHYEWNLRLDMLNQLLNRILLEEEKGLTYQDRAYVTAALGKLGIRDATEFMKEIRRMKETYLDIEQMIRLYRIHEDSLKEVFAHLKEHSPADDSGEAAGEAASTFVQAVYKRLETGRIYQEVAALNKGQPYARGEFHHTEFQTAGLLLVSRQLLLASLKEAILQEGQPAFDGNGSPYERPWPERGAVDKRQVEIQLSQAVLYSLLQNSYGARIEDHEKRQASWMEFHHAVYQTAQDVFTRVESYRREPFSLEETAGERREQAALCRRKELGLLQALSSHIKETVQALGKQAISWKERMPAAELIHLSPSQETVPEKPDQAVSAAPDQGSGEPVPVRPDNERLEAEVSKAVSSFREELEQGASEVGRSIHGKLEGEAPEMGRSIREGLEEVSESGRSIREGLEGVSESGRSIREELEEVSEMGRSIREGLEEVSESGRLIREGLEGEALELGRSIQEKLKVEASEMGHSFREGLEAEALEARRSFRGEPGGKALETGHSIHEELEGGAQEAGRSFHEELGEGISEARLVHKGPGASLVPGSAETEEGELTRLSLEGRGSEDQKSETTEPAFWGTKNGKGEPGGGTQAGGSARYPHLLEAQDSLQRYESWLTEEAENQEFADIELVYRTGETEGLDKEDSLTGRPADHTAAASNTEPGKKGSDGRRDKELETSLRAYLDLIFSTAGHLKEQVAIAAERMNGQGHTRDELLEAIHKLPGKNDEIKRPPGAIFPEHLSDWTTDVTTPKAEGKYGHAKGESGNRSAENLEYRKEIPLEEEVRGWPSGIEKWAETLNELDAVYVLGDAHDPDGSSEASSEALSEAPSEALSEAYGIRLAQWSHGGETGEDSEGHYLPIDLKHIFSSRSEEWIGEEKNKHENNAVESGKSTSDIRKNFASGGKDTINNDGNIACGGEEKTKSGENTAGERRIITGSGKGVVDVVENAFNSGDHMIGDGSLSDSVESNAVSGESRVTGHGINVGASGSGAIGHQVIPSTSDADSVGVAAADQERSGGGEAGNQEVVDGLSAVMQCLEEVREGAERRAQSLWAEDHLLETEQTPLFFAETGNLLPSAAEGRAGVGDAAGNVDARSFQSAASEYLEKVKEEATRRPQRWDQGMGEGESARRLHPGSMAGEQTMAGSIDPGRLGGENIDKSPANRFADMANDEEGPGASRYFPKDIQYGNYAGEEEPSSDFPQGQYGQLQTRSGFSAPFVEPADFIPADLENGDRGELSGLDPMKTWDPARIWNRENAQDPDNTRDPVVAWNPANTWPAASTWNPTNTTDLAYIQNQANMQNPVNMQNPANIQSPANIQNPANTSYPPTASDQESPWNQLNAWNQKNAWNRTNVWNQTIEQTKSGERGLPSFQNQPAVHALSPAPGFSFVHPHPSSQHPSVEWNHPVAWDGSGGPGGPDGPAGPVRERDMDSVKRYLDQINEENVRRYRSLEQAEEVPGSAAIQVKADMKRIRDDALLALRNPEKMREKLLHMPELLPELLDPGEKRAETILRHADKNTRYIYNQVHQYYEGRQARENTGVRPVTQVQFLAGLDQFRQEAAKRQALTESQLSVRPVQIGTDGGRPVEEVYRKAEGTAISTVPLVLRQMDRGISEELLEQLTKRQDTAVKQEVITKVREITKTERIQTETAVKHTVEKETRRVQDLVEKEILKQVGTISDKVYQKLETRLKSERFRRGK